MSGGLPMRSRAALAALAQVSACGRSMPTAAGGRVAVPRATGSADMEPSSADGVRRAGCRAREAPIRCATTIPRWRARWRGRAARGRPVLRVRRRLLDQPGDGPLSSRERFCVAAARRSPGTFGCRSTPPDCATRAPTSCDAAGPGQGGFAVLLAGAEGLRATRADLRARSMLADGCPTPRRGARHRPRSTRAVINRACRRDAPRRSAGPARPRPTARSSSGICCREPVSGDAT